MRQKEAIMAKSRQNTWQEIVDGVSRTFTVDIKKQAFNLSVDGTACLNGSFKYLGTLTGHDFPFALDGQDLRLTISPNLKEMDIVKDGVYLSSGKAYVPFPKWAWLFVVPLLPLVYVGGALGALIGIVGLSMCAKASKASMGIIVRVLLCLGSTAAAWAVYFIVAILLAMLIG
jgi:hypothetical protein